MPLRLLLPLILLAQVVCASDLHFIVFGDWGTGGAQQKLVAESMARYAAESAKSDPVKFAISVGDNFYEDGVSGLDDPRWQSCFEQMYDPVRMNFPFYAVLGNHDWRGDPMAQLFYSVKNPQTRWRMEGFWYARPFPEDAPEPLAEFFFIDTDLWTVGMKPLAEKQRLWLERSLAASKAKWKMVVGHHPIFSSGEHHGEAKVVSETLLPIFDRERVDCYFAGHDHDLQRIQVDGRPTMFLVSGAAGKIRKMDKPAFGPFYAAKPGFLAVKITGAELNGTFFESTASGNVELHRWQQSSD